MNLTIFYSNFLDSLHHFVKINFIESIIIFFLPDHLVIQMNFKFNLFNF
jgi:hypothetical protein